MTLECNYMYVYVHGACISLMNTNTHFNTETVTDVHALTIMCVLLSSSTIHMAALSGLNSMRWLMGVPVISSFSGGSSSSSSTLTIVKHRLSGVVMEMNVVVPSMGL